MVSPVSRREPDQPIRHPLLPTRIGTRNMGISVKENPRVSPRLCCHPSVVPWDAISA